MTKEQEKMFVQQGDVVLVQGVVDKAHKSGDLLVWFKTASGGNSHAWIGKEYVGKTWAVAPEKPKYDPCRLFKKGDKVQPRAGRDVYACEWEDAVFHKLTGIYELESDEKEGHVTIFDNETGIECYVSVFAVELVTPVEELEPYYVKDDGTHYVVGKRPEEPEIVYLAEYSKDRHPHAKEAAEAECKRLNAEYGKEVGDA